MESQASRVFAVTGASTGLGLRIAKTPLAEGADVAASSPRKGRKRMLEGKKVPITGQASDEFDYIVRFAANIRPGTAGIGMAQERQPQICLHATVSG